MFSSVQFIVVCSIDPRLNSVSPFPAVWPTQCRILAQWQWIPQQLQPQWQQQSHRTDQRQWRLQLEQSDTQRRRRQSLLCGTIVAAAVVAAAAAGSGRSWTEQKT